jgi:hypothetical protein
MFSNQPVAAWGYGFFATKSIAPFSESLSNAVTDALRSGLIIERAAGYVLTSRGEEEAAFLSSLERFARRRQYITAACNSTLAVPLPRVGSAVTAEPGLRQALALSSTRPLLGESGSQALHEHFDALSEAVPDHADLFLAAVTWISFLAAQIEARSVSADLEISDQP